MGIRILVVDDESTLRNVIGRVLRRAGHDVAEAASAHEALALFREEPRPLVITDILMPGMNGLEMLDELKLIDPETLVVVMTSHASLETATTALRAGAYDYLIKPFDELEQITKVVDRAAEKIELIGQNRKLVGQLEDLNRSLTAMAKRDGLTGLYNHRHFREVLEDNLARARRHNRDLSLIFADIDQFKTYNDTHGHQAGDRLLETMASLIRNRCRATDISARYGGEEFVVVLPETPKEGALACAESIRRIVEEHPFPGREAQPSGQVTLSLGVASFPEDAGDIAALIDCADKAMYRAKNEGRNRVAAWEAEPATTAVD